MKVLGVLIITCFSFLVEADWTVSDANNLSFKCATTIFMCGSLTKQTVWNINGANTYTPATPKVCSELANAIKKSGRQTQYTCPNGKGLSNYVVYDCKGGAEKCDIGGSCDSNSSKKCTLICGGKCGGGGGGDPHFRTHDGTLYSYHGQCDLVMARSPSFGSSLGLDVHARTKIVDGWSLISNAAVKVGEDIFELNHNGSHFFNGIENVDTPLLLAGKYSVTRGQETLGSADEGSNVQTWYKVELENGQSIRISNFKTMISVKVDAHLHDTAGMLGMANKPGLVARDGESIIEKSDEMGSEWQVTDVEPFLFQEVRAPQYPASCILPTVDTRHLRATKQSSRRAEEACAGVTDAAMRSFCLEDVLLTGDFDLALKYGDLF